MVVSELMNEEMTIPRRRPLRPEELFDIVLDQRTRAEKAEAEVERLRAALLSCWHAANTYDGNYASACDGVMTIAAAGLEENLQPSA